MRVLAFTVSYHRPYFLRHCVTQMNRQTYENLTHAVSITDDELSESAAQDDYKRILFSDLAGCRARFSFHPNRDQHRNYLSAITSVPDYREYDLFVKVDDDDIYKRDYVSRCVTFHEQAACDISSTAAAGQLNGGHVRKGQFHDLGHNPSGSNFCMPQTFAFNLRALDVLLALDPHQYSGWEDEAWRCAWMEQGLVHQDRPDEAEFIWHIHGRNISVGGLLQVDPGPLSGKTVFRAFDCRHSQWVGTIYLYDDGTYSVSTNGDQGYWTFVEGHILELRWDHWERECLLYDMTAGHYFCAEKAFAAIDVTEARRGMFARPPRRTSERPLLDAAPKR